MKATCMCCILTGSCRQFLRSSRIQYDLFVKGGEYLLLFVSVVYVVFVLVAFVYLISVQFIYMYRFSFVSESLYFNKYSITLYNRQLA